MNLKKPGTLSFINVFFTSNKLSLNEKYRLCWKTRVNFAKVARPLPKQAGSDIAGRLVARDSLDFNFTLTEPAGLNYFFEAVEGLGDAL